MNLSGSNIIIDAYSKVIASKADDKLLEGDARRDFVTYAIGQMHDFSNIGYSDWPEMLYRSWLDTTGRTPEVAKECMHIWQEYRGIMYRYDFCTICDEKTYIVD